MANTANATGTRANFAELQGDRDIVTSRLFNAPRSLVWKAWTDPAHIGEWWGPNGFTTTTHSMDVRPGGVWDFIVHGPDGVGFPSYVVYREVLPEHRLVYIHGRSSKDVEVGFLQTVTFEESAGQTRVTMHLNFPTPTMRDFVVREHHAVEGGRQTLERLAAFLAIPTTEPPHEHGEFNCLAALMDE
jgi:uncharacterized protein YndB with AHSA1/START domain